MSIESFQERARQELSQHLPGVLPGNIPTNPGVEFDFNQHPEFWGYIDGSISVRNLRKLGAIKARKFPRLHHLFKDYLTGHWIVPDGYYDSLKSLSYPKEPGLDEIFKLLAVSKLTQKHASAFFDMAEALDCLSYKNGNKWVGKMVRDINYVCDELGLDASKDIDYSINEIEILSGVKPLGCICVIHPQSDSEIKLGYIPLRSYVDQRGKRAGAYKYYGWYVLLEDGEVWRPPQFLEDYHVDTGFGQSFLLTQNDKICEYLKEYFAKLNTRNERATEEVLAVI